MEQSYPMVCVTPSGQRFIQDTSQGGYYLIKEWGVRGKQPAKLTLEYTMSNQATLALLAQKNWTLAVTATFLEAQS